MTFNAHSMLRPYIPDDSSIFVPNSLKLENELSANALFYTEIILAFHDRNNFRMGSRTLLETIFRSGKTMDKSRISQWTMVTTLRLWDNYSILHKWYPSLYPY